LFRPRGEELECLNSVHEKFPILRMYKSFHLPVQGTISATPPPSAPILLLSPKRPACLWGSKSFGAP
jgi:hypothetical protein